MRKCLFVGSKLTFTLIELFISVDLFQFSKEVERKQRNSYYSPRLSNHSFLFVANRKYERFIATNMHANKAIEQKKEKLFIFHGSDRNFFEGKNLLQPILSMDENHFVVTQLRFSL